MKYPITMTRLFASLKSPTMQRLFKSAERLTRRIPANMGEIIQEENQEIERYRAIGEDLDQPLRVLRTPPWARVAIRNTIIRPRPDASGRYVWIAPKGFINRFYYAAGLDSVMSLRAFCAQLVDEDGKEISYASRKQEKKTELGRGLPSELEKELKTLKK